MAKENRSWMRQGETFWRAHHEAWKRSDLNQRQYCEAQGPLEAFGNWRATFKAEPELPERKAALPASGCLLARPIRFERVTLAFGASLLPPQPLPGHCRGRINRLNEPPRNRSSAG